MFLKQRHAEGAFEDRFQALVEIRDLLLSRAAGQIRVQHVALDRPGPDDRHFDHHVVKSVRLHPRERRHLRAAFDLKDTDRVRTLHQFVGRGIILRDRGEIDRATARLAQFNRVLHHRHHAEPEQIDLDDAEVLAVVLVPLRHDASGHARRFERDDRARVVPGR